jgi:hypothetical protein
MDARLTRPSPSLGIGVKAAIFSLDAQAHPEWWFRPSEAPAFLSV